MKRLLIAPFLLASLFSFGGELKANPRYSNSGKTPTASAQRWYMVTIATKQVKIPASFSSCPLRNYYTSNNGTFNKSSSPANICDPSHNHIFTFSKWLDYESALGQPNNIAFKSLAECNAQARNIKNFYDSHRFDGSLLSHSHYLGEKGGWGKKPNLYNKYSSTHEHTSELGETSRFYFIHKCIPGTVDY